MFKDPQCLLWKDIKESHGHAQMASRVKFRWALPCYCYPSSWDSLILRNKGSCYHSSWDSNPLGTREVVYKNKWLEGTFPLHPSLYFRLLVEIPQTFLEICSLKQFCLFIYKCNVNINTLKIKGREHPHHCSPISLPPPSSITF